MKTFKITSFIFLLIALPFMVGCSSDDNKPKEPLEGSYHTYDITINPGSKQERHLQDKIKNASTDDGTMNNFSVYAKTPNGKGVVLRIGNDDILMNGLFFHDNNGNTADLFDGSEDDSEEKSHLIMTIAPPSEEVYNSISGKVNLSKINDVILSDEGGVMAYTIKFDGQFEDYDDTISQIKGTIVVELPSYLKG